MRYFVVTRSDIISGGPELAHQMCCELLQNGRIASMYYISKYQREPIDTPVPEPYAKYGTSHATDIHSVEMDDAVVIFTDGSTTYMPLINRCIKVLWWMSVDNYILTTKEQDIEAVRNQVQLHLVQSQYAYDYVKNHVGIPEKNILFVSDYLSEAYGKFVLPDEYRQDLVLFNPKKGFEDLQPVIQRTPYMKWIPLIDLDQEQMVVLMQSAKIYIDFGGHPGKDRIPREAAVCGCCVITNTKGSAAYEEDVPIPAEYKFDHINQQYEQIIQLMIDIFNNFKVHSAKFEHYRSIIKSEKQRFSKAVKQFIEIVENRYQQ